MYLSSDLVKPLSEFLDILRQPIRASKSTHARGMKNPLVPVPAYQSRSPIAKTARAETQPVSSLQLQSQCE